jgi:lactose/L-arabinose transport system permease protein
MASKTFKASLLLHTAVSLAALVWLLPIWLMVVYSTHTPDALFTTPMPVLPSDQFMINFAALQERVDFLGAIWSSIQISVVFTLGSLAITTLAGYAFWRFEGSSIRYAFGLILATMAIPTIALILPQFVMVVRGFGLGNTYAGLLLPYFANAIGIFFMRQIFAGLPIGIIDAAKLDGAGEWRIFFRIALPLVVPGMTALAIILFLTAWTDYLWPLLILQDPDSMTAPVALGILLGGYRVNWAVVMVATVLVTVPFVVLFLFLQRFLISGITAGAMK